MNEIITLLEVLVKGAMIFVVILIVLFAISDIYNKSKK